MFLRDIAGVAIAFAVVLIAYYRWAFLYWKRKNLPYLEPRIPFGNLSNPTSSRVNVGMNIWELYKEMRRKKWKHGGMFFICHPVYLPLDLDYIRNVLAKDFKHFSARGLYYNERDDPISASLIAADGTKWKNLKMKLSPTFTPARMKMMFHTMVESQRGLLERIDEECARQRPIDIKEVLACFTTDVIGSCAFGLECQTFKEENSQFRHYGKRFTSSTGLEVFRQLVCINFPNAARALGVTITPKDVEKFFTKLVTDTVSYREKNNVRRKDFMQLLIDLKNNTLAEEDGYKRDGNTLTIEEIVSQSAVFFIAGYETSSSTMSFALYELAKQQDIQERLRSEVTSVLAKYEGGVTYEAIQEMKYMDQVIDETLRKYPPLAFITRKCVEDYKIPGEDITLDKGKGVVISIYGVHYDEEYYPDPQKFDPERFNSKNKSERHKFAFLPFGEGPRMCIGMRFGLMQTKIGLTALIRDYKFSVNARTQEPLTMKPNSYILATESEIWLNVEKVEMKVTPPFAVAQNSLVLK